MNISIRPVAAGDPPALAAIISAADLFPPEMLGDMIAPYLSGDAPDIWFAATDGDEPGAPLAVGYCAPERMTEGTWNLLALAVHPDAQGKGAGAAMLRWIERRLKDDGARILLVETLGAPEFAGQRAFYARAGYAEEARIRDYYEPGGDKVVFWKRVDDVGS